ncbi:MAG: hypothetical protein ABIQ99_01950 [Thermoflexales bacterium]
MRSAVCRLLALQGAEVVVAPVQLQEAWMLALGLAECGAAPICRNRAATLTSVQVSPSALVAVASITVAVLFMSLAKQPGHA